MRLISSVLLFVKEFAIRHPGVTLVFIGVLGEACEIVPKLLFKYRSQKFDRGLELIGAFFWAVLVVGLGWEFIEAVKLDSRVEISERRVEELRKENDALEAKQRARTITFQQLTNFAFITAKIPKIAIRITIGPLRDEPMSFASNMRLMLNQAGFVVPDSDTNYVLGVRVDPTAFMFTNVGDTNEWPDLRLLTDTTNSPMEYKFQYEVTNGLNRPIIGGNDTNQIYSALIFSLQQIGIRAGWGHKPDWVQPNHCAIYIYQRPY